MCVRANVSKGNEYPLKRCINNLVCAYWAKIQCFDLKADNRIDLATVWKVLVVSMVGFNDFQRKPRFGSKVSDRIMHSPKKPTSRLFSLLCFVELEAPILDYLSRYFKSLSTYHSFSKKYTIKIHHNILHSQ